MKRKHFNLRIAAIVFLGLYFQLAHADFSGRVVSVADGDTITMLHDREQVKVSEVRFNGRESHLDYAAILLSA